MKKVFLYIERSRIDRREKFILDNWSHEDYSNCADLLNRISEIKKELYLVGNVDQVNDTIKLYKNGFYWYKGQISTLEPKSGLLSIGALINNTGAFKGKIDDIAIYNRALTQEEITAIYLGNCTKPLAAITPKSTTNIKENETVVLAATKGNGYTYAWYKDGITIVNAKDSNYTATSPGLYTVKISTSATCDSTSAAVTVKRVYALPNYLPKNGLVGWWPFNGNANDESGNENHGTVNGATLTSDRNGEVNKAYSFNGLSNSINFADTFILNSNQNGTISLWLNNFEIPSGNAYSTFLFSRNTIGETDRYNFYLQPSGTTSRLAIDYREENINQHVLNETPFNYFNNNVWYNILFFGCAKSKKIFFRFMSFIKPQWVDSASVRQDILCIFLLQ
jgi:hypothetical protein